MSEHSAETVRLTRADMSSQWTVTIEVGCETKRGQAAMEDFIKRMPLMPKGWHVFRFSIAPEPGLVMCELAPCSWHYKGDGGPMDAYKALNRHRRASHPERYKPEPSDGDARG